MLFSFSYKRIILKYYYVPSCSDKVHTPRRTLRPVIDYWFLFVLRGSSLESQLNTAGRLSLVGEILTLSVVSIQFSSSYITVLLHATYNNNYWSMRRKSEYKSKLLRRCVRGHVSELFLSFNKR